jgi:hypothetical protein
METAVMMPIVPPLGKPYFLKKNKVMALFLKEDRFKNILPIVCTIITMS